MIFIHGMACSPQDWAAQMDHFAKVADVTAPDLPGHKEASLPTEGSIGARAEAVNQVRRVVPPQRTVLIGHSMGCRIALEAAWRMPEDLAGLVFLEGSSRSTGNAAEAVRLYRSHSAEDNRASLLRDFAGMFGEEASESLRTLVLQRVRAMDKQFLALLMEDMTRWDAEDAVKRLQAVSVPVLAIQSTYKEPGKSRRPIKNGEMPPWLSLHTEHVPRDVQIIWLPNMDHFPHIEAPDKVTAPIDAFMKSISLLTY